jgi:hypothetical protein
MGGALNFRSFSPHPNTGMEPNQVALELLVDEVKAQRVGQFAWVVAGRPRGNLHS